MTNLDIYNQIFNEVFNVSESQLSDDFTKETVDNWDSMHQLGVISLIEDRFDIMMEAEDIMALTSYKAGKEILKDKYEITI